MVIFSVSYNFYVTKVVKKLIRCVQFVSFHTIQFIVSASSPLPRLILIPHLLVVIFHSTLSVIVKQIILRNCFKMPSILFPTI